jgi:hypothetical protein
MEHYNLPYYLWGLFISIFQYIIERTRRTDAQTLFYVRPLAVISIENSKFVLVALMEQQKAIYLGARFNEKIVNWHSLFYLTLDWTNRESFEDELVAVILND